MGRSVKEGHARAGGRARICSSDSTRPWGSATVDMGRPKTFIEMRREMNEDNICDIAVAEREIIPGRRKLGCDEIAWISAALDRFAAVARNRNIYSERSMKGAKLACLLEIMDVAGCEFEDDVARHNALSDFPELCPDKPLMNKTQ